MSDYEPHDWDTPTGIPAVSTVSAIYWGTMLKPWYAIPSMTFGTCTDGDTDE